MIWTQPAGHTDNKILYKKKGGGGGGGGRSTRSKINDVDLREYNFWKQEREKMSKFRCNNMQNWFLNFLISSSK